MVQDNAILTCRQILWKANIKASTFRGIFSFTIKDTPVVSNFRCVNCQSMRCIEQNYTFVNSRLREGATDPSSLTGG